MKMVLPMCATVSAAARRRQRVLEIMKDSRVGAYGAIGIALLLALKCVTLASLPGASVVVALLLAHPLSRLASGSLIRTMAYARAEGKAKPLAQQMSNTEFLIAMVTVAVPALLLVALGGMRWDAFLAGMLAAMGATLWLARKFQSRIQGFTGDCLGAVQQVAEAAFYLGMLAAMKGM